MHPAFLNQLEMANFKLRSTGKAALSDAPAKKKGKTWFSKLNAWLHLWPSLISGVILVLVCLSGTLIVYSDEFLEWSAGDARYVEIGPEKASATQIMANVKQIDSTYYISQLVFFNDPGRSVRVRAFNEKTHQLTFIYVNPYTAEVLKIDPTAHFFYVTAHFHASLLAGEVGHWIVTISTIIFVIGCITGLILWWPKRWTKKTVKDSFTIKWSSKFKRLNYDLHNVYGFYSLLICFVLSVTGIFIFFHSLGEVISKSLGGSGEHVLTVLPKFDEHRESLDIAPFAYKALAENPDQENAGIWVYNLKKLGAFVIQLGVSGLKSTENLDIKAYDRYTGEEIVMAKPFIIHEKVENAIWQLHMGQWWGQFGKLSTFLAGMIATSLPITGFLIWWGRRKKKKTPVQKPGLVKNKEIITNASI